MDLRALIEFLKLPQKIMIVIALVSGFIVFGEGSTLLKMDLLEFKTSYHKWISIIFLTSLCISIVNLSVFGYSKIKQIKIACKNKNAKFKRLNSLTPKEKALLKYYIEHETRNQLLDLKDGTIRELEHYGIIYLATEISVGDTYFSYNIQPWAYDYLKRNSHLVQTNHPELDHGPWFW